MSGRAEIILLRTGDTRRAAATQPLPAAGEDRRLLGHLRALRDDEVPAPPGAVAAVLATLQAAALEDHGAGPNRALRLAYVGGITVATAAATTAGVLVWMTRRRIGLAATG